MGEIAKHPPLFWKAGGAVWFAVVNEALGAEREAGWTVWFAVVNEVLEAEREAAVPTALDASAAIRKTR